jgi:hypothetical protein
VGAVRFEGNDVAAPSSESNWRFGAYELDRRSGELRRSGVRIRIQVKGVYSKIEREKPDILLVENFR